MPAIPSTDVVSDEYDKCLEWSTKTIAETTVVDSFYGSLSWVVGSVSLLLCPTAYVCTLADTMGLGSQCINIGKVCQQVLQFQQVAWGGEDAEL
jgi:hypothetical protein